MQRLILNGFFFLFIQTLFAQTTYFVKTDGNDANDELTWTNAKAALQSVHEAASAVDNSVTLKWQTQTEFDNYGFEVERTANLRGLKNENGDSNLGGFSFIGFVKGSGNSNSSKQYSFVDSNPSLGKIQYRLKQIDNDGSFKYSHVVEAELNFIPKEYSLCQNYPNPFNPTTVISYQLPVAGNVTLKIYDVLGREVATLVNEVQQAGKYNVQLSADNYHLSSGVYIYRINAGKFSEEKKMLLLK